MRVHQILRGFGRADERVAGGRDVTQAFADDNENIFYRHENVLVWDQMNRYDEDQGTSFASRFDVESPGEAPPMYQVEAEWLMHKASKKPHALMDDLLRRLSEFSAEQLAAEGAFLQPQLERIRDLSIDFLKMIEATEAA